jgi:hypothetical protein
MTPSWPKEDMAAQKLPPGVPVPPALGAEVTPLDEAYHERNRVLAAFVRSCVARGHRAWLALHEPTPGEPPWDPAWRYVVTLELPLRDARGAPAGQVAWHIHELERPLFGFLRLEKNPPRWDGHSTPAKYDRLAAYVARYDEFYPMPRRPWWWRFMWRP